MRPHPWQRSLHLAWPSVLAILCATSLAAAQPRTRRAPPDEPAEDADPSDEDRAAGAEEQPEQREMRIAVPDDDVEAPPPDEPPPADVPAIEPAPPEAPPIEEPPLPPVEDAPGLTCAATARAAAADAVVRVRSADRWGAGFVYGADNRVVTSFSLIERGRPITVVARDGTLIGAQLLARDDQYDLAVLALNQPVPGAEPLSPAPETSARLGAPVVAMGHPNAGVSALLGDRGAGLLRWSVSQGVIGAVNDAGVQADVALSEGHAGGPLLDCEGRVIGMITGTGRLDDDLGLVARIGHVDDAMEASSGPGDFLGELDLRLGVGGGLVIDEEGRAAAGVYLTLGAALFDRISWMNRVGLFFGGLDDPTGDVLSQNRQLLRITSLLGWRFFIDIGGFTTLYVVPAGGVSVNRDSLDTERVAVVPTDDPACVPSATETCAMADIVRTSTDEWYVRPAVGLTFYLGNNFGIGYTLEIGLETAEVETYHVVRLELLM